MMATTKTNDTTKVEMDVFLSIPILPFRKVSIGRWNTIPSDKTFISPHSLKPYSLKGDQVSRVSWIVLITLLSGSNTTYTRRTHTIGGQCTLMTCELYSKLVRFTWDYHSLSDLKFVNLVSFFLYRVKKL